MTHSQFIKKWGKDVHSDWRNNANEVFWIRCYKMDRKDLIQMCKDFESIGLQTNEIAACVRHKIENIIGKTCHET